VIQEYNALHDPYAKSYFKTPIVQRLLLQQKLVNEKGQVKCSLKEFNDFRKYLRTQFNDLVRETMSTNVSFL